MLALNDTCNLGETYWRMVGNSDYVVYTIMPPIHIALGLIAHLIPLYIFYKQSKYEKAYAYQIFSTISELVYLLSLEALMYTIFHWSTASWFTSSYPLMWYA